MEAVVDTNVLVYAAFEDQSRHREARSLLERLKAWCIPTVVVMEFLWFLRGSGIRWGEARRLILRLLSDGRVRLIRTELEDFLDAVGSAADPGELEDELLLAAAEREGLPVATFDLDLAEKASARGIPVFGSPPRGG